MQKFKGFQPHENIQPVKSGFQIFSPHYGKNYSTNEWITKGFEVWTQVASSNLLLTNNQKLSTEPWTPKSQHII